MTDKYKIAQEVLAEYAKSNFQSDFIDFLKEKTQPPDRLFEMWSTASREIFQNFALFKEYFSDEFKGTAGLDQAMEKVDGVAYGVLKEIKERLEK